MHCRLKIENSVPQDSGNYMCIATNRAGERNATAYLKIKKGWYMYIYWFFSMMKER